MTWTAPGRTTDQLPIRHFGPTRVCRSVAMPLDSCSPVLAEIPYSKPVPSSKNAQAPSKAKSIYIDILPANLPVNPSANFIYALEVMNQDGRSAGLSNRVVVPAAPTLPPPGNFSARVTADGVVLRWTPEAAPVTAGLNYLYRIYRREGSDKQENDKEQSSIAGEVPADGFSGNLTFIDHNFEWEKRYSYRATVVTVIDRNPPPDDQVEGEDTPEVQVFAHDVFPPAVPSGLQAVSATENGQTFVDLIWNPDTETDFAGYNIFRHEIGNPPVKINSDLVKLPAFRDLNVAPRKKYYYSVSSVDIRGNESARSEEANETVP